MAVDEWRKCVGWLVRCQILPLEHKANKPDATAFDLAQALRDGVLLCHLLNTLQPGCIDMKDFSSRPQMSQFLCMKNIRAFLTTCTTYFGMEHKDLFKPNDLFDVKDFKKVLDTLSKLSKTEVSSRRFRGFLNNFAVNDLPARYYNDLELLASGFPPESSTNQADHDDIYGNLQDLAVENDLEEQEDVYDTVYQEEEEKIYDDLLGHKTIAAPTEAAVTKRDLCIKELLDTESNYKTALKMIIDHFIIPLHNVLPSGDRDIIFAHIEPLYEIHKELNEKLIRSVSHGQQKLADIFIYFKPKLLIYGDFCSNLPSAQERVDKICENELLRLKIQECERRSNEGKFRLRDLLHVPMQRVLKYHLLVRELIKNTDKPSSERDSLERALEAMQDLSLYVNEVKRDHESLQVIEEIQKSINDLRMPANTSLKDYGRFQKDGELKVTCHSDNRQRNRSESGKAEKRHIFLFDKVMLMCKAKIVDKFFWGDTYSFKDAIVLGEFRVDESAYSQDKKPDKWISPFVMVKHDRTTAYTFYAKTADQRDKWKEAIAMALDNSQPVNGRNLVMFTFEKPRECDVCGKLLRGIFYQGYLCPENQKAVHKECIGKPFMQPNVTPPLRPPRNGKPTSIEVTAEKTYRGHPVPPSSLKPPLYFDKNDTLEVIAKTDDNWWKGKLQGVEGYFPKGYVKEKRDNPKVSYETVTGVTINGGNTNFFVPRGVDLLSTRSQKQLPVENLIVYPWYVGEMERPTAQKELDSMPDGTFLIRVTNNPARLGELSLSIKYANAVRHIKVNRHADGKFFLAETHYFGSVQDLVDFYQATELSVNFPEVCTTLKHPYKKLISGGPRVLGYAIVIYDYAATSTSQVTLQVGDRISIISKTGQDKGWWKGENLRTKRVGYFPLAYVKDEEEQ